MTDPFRYTRGAELEGLDLTWPEPDGTLYDFTTGWTFTARIGTPDIGLLAKTSGFTGASTAPNLVIAWAAAELDALPVGSYHLDITARLTATSQDLTRTFMLEILPGVPAPPA